MASTSVIGKTTAVLPSELRTFHHNPRQGDIGAIAASLRRHTQYKPITANLGTHTGRPNEVLAGNHTLLAFRQLGQDYPDDKQWHKILVFWVDVDNDTAERIVVADNQTGQIGGFDNAALIELLEGFGDDIEGLGFTDADIAALLALHEENNPDTGADDPTEPPPTPKPEPQPRYDGDQFTLHHGDSLDVLKTLADNSIDAVVTDPPYGLDFMGKAWDTGSTAFSIEFWTQIGRVLRPGGHVLAFGGTRTWHRLAVAVEDAGFEIRDNIAWLYGSGFPKSLDVSKAIDKAAGVERPDRVVSGPANNQIFQPSQTVDNAGTPVTDAAKQWDGWGTALKPAFEPIVVARKPLAAQLGDTVAANVIEHGTGALNIDGCRIGYEADDLAVRTARTGKMAGTTYGHNGTVQYSGGEVAAPNNAGRWPANVVLDPFTAAEVDRQSGVSKSRRAELTSTPGDIYGAGAGLPSHTGIYGQDDEGGASRFFYTAKASPSERPRDEADGTAHPTVKPLELMRWLIRLVTPPKGIVLEPFAGSGTTVEACLLEEMACVAIEREADYIPLIVQRIRRAGGKIADPTGLVDEPANPEGFTD